MQAGWLAWLLQLPGVRYEDASCFQEGENGKWILALIHNGSRGHSQCRAKPVMTSRCLRTGPGECDTGQAAALTQPPAAKKEGSLCCLVRKTRKLPQSPAPGRAMGRRSAQYNLKNLCGSQSLPREPQAMPHSRLSTRQDGVQVWHESLLALKQDTVLLPFPRSAAGPCN